jgi:hypothetical protein
LSQQENPLNPYSPPTLAGESPIGADESHEATPAPASLARTAVRWLTVCSLSAIPSFVFGLAVTAGQFAAMVTGILLFVLGYTVADYQTAGSAWRGRRITRRTLKIAYGTRIAISLLLPLGAYIDIACGVLSLQVTQSLTGEGLERFDSNGGMTFFPTLLTTLVQGTLLNVVLGVYALVILAVQALIIALRR